MKLSNFSTALASWLTTKLINSTALTTSNMKDSDCIFCKIANKEIPAEIVYEDEKILVFPTKEPITKGHLLVVPKIHSENILDIDKETLEKLIGVAQTLAQQSIKQNSATGVNVLHAAGKDAQQSVFHFHMHIVPRYSDDGLDLWFRNKL